MVEGTLGETSGTLVVEKTNTNSRDAGFVAVAEDGGTFDFQGVEVEGEASDSLAFVVQHRALQPLVPSQSVSKSETQERVVCTRSDTGPVLSFVQGSNVPEDIIAFRGHSLQIARCCSIRKMASTTIRMVYGTHGTSFLEATRMLRLHPLALEIRRSVRCKTKSCR